MKIQKAIDRAFSLRPDSFSIPTKVEWLNELDGQIWLELFSVRENPEGITFEQYNDEDLDRELLIPFPYDKLYPSYLKMKALEAYGDTDDYNNAAYAYNKQMADFKVYWGRTHRQRKKEQKTAFDGILYVYPNGDPFERNRSK